VGKTVLILRLATRDLRRRPAEALMVLLVIAVAVTALTLGLALKGTTDNPYQQTRTATAGPDVVANYVGRDGGPASLDALTQASGVVGHSGPYPIANPVLRADGDAVTVTAEGRDSSATSVDQPEVTSGSWVRPGGIVVERGLADSLGLRAGDPITLSGLSFRVAGVAVTAAMPSYPMSEPGLIWVTRADAQRLGAPAAPIFYVMNLKLADPADAQAFADAHSRTGLSLMTSQFISDQDASLVVNSQQDLLVGSWLLALLAAASVAVLVGGRMAEQTRRVGLLKAVGSTPGLVTAVLLAENLLLALLAAAAGLLAGRLTAPLLTSPGAGLIGTPGPPSLSLSSAALVTAVALAVAMIATAIPAVRAARSSTVRSLTDSARPPRRHGKLIVASAALPVPLLLGLRLAVRRPRRSLLTVCSIAVTVTTLIAVLTFQRYADNSARAYGSFGAANPQNARNSQVLLVITIALVVLAAISAIFTTWATVQDARRPSALARALGATPEQVTAGLSAAQLLPALLGAVLGIPLGLGLYAAVSSGQSLPVPPAWSLAAVVLASLLVLAGLTAIPARIGARHSVAEVLQADAT
jgi:putative ABC transport system permease protein